ncbi:hypothetical protein CesoFtcFv8_020605 [Champsocephalus esox]|uniref:Uncharacterized protein n=1 Tax=Champsocephalus esox TaxID=159716 RepID=A0AAN8BCH8_9TELE|nr:hypothetical protein CesoFtcFv8_020605 [Champsocephalus esox]
MFRQCVQLQLREAEGQSRSPGLCEPLSAVLNLEPRITSRPEGGQREQGGARDPGGNPRQTGESRDTQMHGLLNDDTDLNPDTAEGGEDFIH